MNDSQTISFRLLDITGRVLIKVASDFIMGVNPPFSINTQNLPGGMYFLEAASATQQKVIKVVKD